jgi:pyruvate,orthophosphate dikinase
VGEVRKIKDMIARVEAEVSKEAGTPLPDYKVGIMTEIPSACLNAGEFAKHVEFFSYGTNDLTQTTLGISRDDTGDVTAKYLQEGIYQSDPFQTIHPDVARLMEMGIIEGKKANPDLDVSVCGEHGGDPASIHTCQKIGVDAVSVSPPRIPVARLVTAQAMLEHELEVGSWKARGGRKSGVAPSPN